MRYELTRLVFEERRTLAVGETDFAKGRTAWRNALLCLGLEERFNLVLENYGELESELLRLALQANLFRTLSWSDRVDQLHLLNRRLSNLLSICRVYVDQTPVTLNDIFRSSSAEAEQFRAAASAEYDSRIGFRAMEALRNYAQHRGLPIHVIGDYSRWNEDRSAKENWVIPSLSLDEIKSIGGLKQSVVEELAELKQPVDLRALIREYITSLRRIHNEVRSLADDAAIDADRITDDLLSMWYEDGEIDNKPALDLVARADQDLVVDRVPVLREIGRRRRYLIQRNRLDGDLAKQVVSNRIG